MSTIKELIQDYVEAILYAYEDFNLPSADAHVILYAAIDKLEEDTKLLQAHLESCRVLQEMNGEKIEKLEAENAALKARIAELEMQEPECWIDPTNLKAMREQSDGTFLRYITTTPDIGDVALYTQPKASISLNGLINILKRWGTYGEAMQKSGSELPRLLIAETRARLNAAPKAERLTRGGDE